MRSNTYSIPLNDANQAGGWRCGNPSGGNLCKLELVDTGQPVKHGADADTRHLTGKTPTIPSAKDGEDILRRLSSHENVNVSQKDMNNRDAQSWACVSGSCSVVKRVVTKMQGIGEWRTRCSAALPHVLTSEAPDALLNALHRHEDDEGRAEMLKAAGSKADGNAGVWTLRPVAIPAEAAHAVHRRNTADSR
ncbi:hypothetical protein MGU_08525 [Metarhizium guizhouense ARSEF 977]|uniref:Uncharacterized protein n=1 Tax=Metarhizium guizhouense (strain ARSEF 977) TaxID=1276136 RepID=A0A0B4GWZ4_METGA|nr:hypothetical protein MGU_08525 [Metarhizium guizhouense ARSEF 977]